MLIGIDASRAISSRPTGTEIYSQQLIQALLSLESQQVHSRQHRFRLYTRSVPSTGPFATSTRTHVEVRPIPFPRLWTHVRLSWELACHPPDLLFVPAHVLPPIRPPACLVTIHDLGYLYFPKAHPWQQRLYLDLSTRWNARVATHVLAVSQATKSDLVSRYAIPAGKITVAYPGHDETLAPVRDPAVIEAAKARYGIAGDYFLYLGTLQPRKNLARLIHAFASLQSETLLVLAGKRGWLYEDLLIQVRRLGLEPRVIFPGYIADTDKAPLLSGALALTFPSLYEGFGFPVVEAQACGCPVITSITSSLPEAAGEAALLIDPTETAAITTAMQHVTADPALRETLAERGLENARRFSWMACAQVVRDAIEQCAAATSPGF